MATNLDLSREGFQKWLEANPANEVIDPHQGDPFATWLSEQGAQEPFVDDDTVDFRDPDGSPHMFLTPVWYLFFCQDWTDEEVFESMTGAQALEILHTSDEKYQSLDPKATETKELLTEFQRKHFGWRY